MQYLKTKLIRALITHFGDDDRRIEHANFRILWDSDLFVNTADTPNLDRAKFAAKVDEVFETEAGRELGRGNLGRSINLYCYGLT